MRYILKEAWTVEVKCKTVFTKKEMFDVSCVTWKKKVNEMQLFTVKNEIKTPKEKKVDLQ